MFVIVDTIQDTTANIMKLNIKQVEGIEEPVKMISSSSAGFAVGKNSN